MAGSNTAKGTELWVLNTLESPDEIVKIVCLTNAQPGGTQVEQIEDTCFDEDTRTYTPGYGTPDQMTFDVVYKLGDASHQFLDSQMNGDRTQFEWCIGMSDGTNAPTECGGALVAPTQRSSRIFDATVTNFAVTASQGDVYRATLTLQRSGPFAFTYKTPA